MTKTRLEGRVLTVLHKMDFDTYLKASKVVSNKTCINIPYNTGGAAEALKKGSKVRKALDKLKKYANVMCIPIVTRNNSVDLYIHWTL